MTAAYDKKYLQDAMNCLGEAVDYCQRACEIDFDTFMDMFIVGGFAGRFELGDITVISGMSGTEMVIRAIDAAGLRIKYPEQIVEYEGLSYEYWIGMMLAYLQWYSGRSFKDITEGIDMNAFLMRIPELVEMDDTGREKVFDEFLAAAASPVRLQSMRKRCGLSQKELADKSGVNIRTLQQYEIRSKDINKAAAVTLKALAAALGCIPEDIMEYAVAEEHAE